jgi:hypothetical protein
MNRAVMAPALVVFLRKKSQQLGRIEQARATGTRALSAGIVLGRHAVGLKIGVNVRQKFNHVIRLGSGPTWFICAKGSVISRLLAGTARSEKSRFKQIHSDSIAPRISLAEGRSS